MLHDKKADAANIGLKPFDLINTQQKGFLVHDDKQMKSLRQWSCSFCGLQDLPDDSICFRGVAACSHCLELMAFLDDALRSYKAESEAQT